MEAYVSFNTAKLLKENGFKECNRPTLQLAVVWLREKGYHIETFYSIKYDYWVRSIKKTRGIGNGCVWSLGGFDTKEEAIREAIEYALFLVIR